MRKLKYSFSAANAMDVRSQRYSGYVWLAAAAGLVVYGAIGLLGKNVPGAEELLAWMQSVDGQLIIVAAGVSILIEGLYFVGSFFPGTTLVILFAAMAQVQNTASFMLTIAAIFLGWIGASVCNIVFARWYALRLGFTRDSIATPESDHFLASWFPAFRSNVEVAQVIAGVRPWHVFYSSVRVKVFGTILLMGAVFIFPLMIDVHEIDNEEGFTTIFVMAAIMAGVGCVQLRKSCTQER